MSDNNSTEAPLLTCTCCGKGIRDTVEENAAHGVFPSPHDEGFGECRECFGAPAKTSRKPPTEAQIKKSLGWAGRAFYEARFKVLAANLNEKNAEHFTKMTYAQKVAIVSKMIERGLMT